MVSTASGTAFLIAVRTCSSFGRTASCCAAIDLLVRAIPEFPQNTVPDNVARLIYQRTAGQPYLLQLFGTLLINRLNEEERGAARLDDVAAIETAKRWRRSRAVSLLCLRDQSGDGWNGDA